MEKIQQLTPTQEKALQAFRDKWLSIGLATGPANLPVIQPVIYDFYQRIDQPTPYLWRCESPMMAQLVINFLRANLGDNLGDTLRDNLWDTLRDNLGDTLGANLGVNLWDTLGANLRANQLHYIYTGLWGSLDAYWIAYYLFPHLHVRKMHNDQDMILLNGWATLAKNAFWLYPFEGVCFVCDRPSIIHQDAQSRLHCETDMAISFSDGWGLYRWHGVEVPKAVILQPESITVDQIESEPNVEVRRVMLERYGQERYLLDSGAQEIASDGYGVLYRKSLPDDEPLVMVKVKNSTPEPDGSIRDYFLRVPPSIETAHAAVAWTFDMNVQDYYPKFES